MPYIELVVFAPEMERMCKMCFTEHDIRASMCVHQMKHARLNSFTYDLRSCLNFGCLSYTNACKYTSSRADTTTTFTPLTLTSSNTQGWANKHKEQGKDQQKILEKWKERHYEKEEEFWRVSEKDEARDKGKDTEKQIMHAYETWA